MTGMARPTPNQAGVELGRQNRARIVDALLSLSEDHERPPTRGEIAEYLGLSVEAVYRHVRVLIAEGVLAEPDGPGSLQLK